MERESIELSGRYGMHIEEFSSLMARRVLDILLVASQYDAFVLEEDGQLTELVTEEYRSLDLNLRYAPRFIRASTGAEALAILAEREIDMLVTTPRLRDTSLKSFIEGVKAERPQLPVGLLAAHAWDLPWLEPIRQSGMADWIFLWQGSVRALLAMIKQVEDRQNADHDILEGGVQAIILVEDEVRFYSAYLPHIYTEVTTQTSRLMAEGLNLSHRLLRIRARPKILLAQTYEQAWDLYERYAGNVLGIISDASFPREGVQDPEAGLRLAQAVRNRNDDIPFLLQSMDTSLEARSGEVGASFLAKASPTLLEDLRRFILENFGFGDFVFRVPDGQPVARARDIREMVRLLAEVPDESLVHHAARNHFSAWLKARTEFELASMLRPRTVSEFASPAELRAYLIDTLTTYLREIQQHVIVDFKATTFDDLVAFARLGSGSIGGKGRGLAFMHKLLAQGGLDLPGATVAIPQTLVVASDVFEQFLDRNRMRSLVMDAPGMDDEQILAAFRRARFPNAVRSQLARFLETVTEPLAIRSSSILEDSAYQPFAGVYATVMLPNSHASVDVRLAQLFEAIKVVYASTYFRRALDYLESTPYRSEEELMAVLIQRLVGSRRGDLFYPTLAGVASSYNFYPFGSIRPEDGVAQVALGLGKSVVEGYTAIRFSPRHPQVLPQFSSVKDILRNAQRHFYALDMSREDVIPSIVTDANLARTDVAVAVASGAAAPIASTYRRSDDTITAGLSGRGTPLVTFAPLLKGRVLPLPELLCRLLATAEAGIANPVELEFAADILPGLGQPQTFQVLQVRPLVVEKMGAAVDLDSEAEARALVRSSVALGHGRRESIADVVLVAPDRLGRSATAQAAVAIESINRSLREAGRTCILIGPGRWGTRDPWLGIPVAWSQISTARVIVETDFPDLQVEPSFGSHFFHNLTSFGVAFLVVHAASNGGFINWAWFDQQSAIAEALDGAVRHVRLTRPAEVVVDGSSGRGVILEGDVD